MTQSAATPGSAEGFRLVGLGFGARLAGMAIGVLAAVATLILTVRLLDPDSYGAFAFALSVASILAGLGRLGLEPALTRAIATLRDEHAALTRVARGGFSVVAVSGAVGALVLFLVVDLGLPDLTQATRLALAIGLGLSLYGSNAAAVGGSVARGAGRVVLMELPNLMGTLVRLAAIALLTALDVGELTWVAVGYAAAALVSTASAWGVTTAVAGRIRLFQIDRAAAREVFVSALPFAVGGVALVIVSRFDVVVLGFTGTDTDVGVYEPTLRIVEQAMLIVPLLFIAQYLPVASRAVAAHDTSQFRELYLSLSKLVYVLAFPGVLLFAAFPQTVLQTLYGAGFPVDRTVVWLLLGGFVVNLAFGLNASALASTGNRRALATTGAVAIVSMVVLSLALIPAFGPAGAAAATAGTYVILNAAVAVELARLTRVVPVRTDYLVTLFSSAVPLAVALAIDGWLDSVNLLEAICCALVLSSVWAGLLLAVGTLRREELRRLVPGRGTPA